MLVALLVLGILNLSVLTILVLQVQALQNLSDQLTKLRRLIEDNTVTPGGLRLGRAIPSVAEIQAAKNRIDATGTAHPGGP